ncbi:hypothetical protein LWC05_15490 [Acetobacter sicerae]|uniref:Lipoprotein n=1 Tax=Acetobacter sicerae TaxID=85325 RepID=A0ABS8W158_9PROT|nr:hypothetical protein [Acetobacter sicerae]MCE0745279.1 hypothetical protein [Acetobacter sicerae]
MKRSRYWLLLPVLAVSGCMSAQQEITQKEDHLAAAGFILKPANTPERAAMLTRLPPHRFLRRDKGDLVTYVYADPNVCDCLYVGSQQAYATYRANQQAQYMADENRMTAEAYEDSAWDWGMWGPWGGGPGYGYGPGWWGPGMGW